MDTELAKDVIKDVTKDVYADGGKAIIKPTGELVGLVPRAIKAALAPLEKWILQREYNVAETKKLLEEKLKSVPPELIEPPEAHIAVPAMQCISYCMDNNDLRDMYANLLANSMISIVKNGVHPGFVEIIKQLSPDEAKILKCISIEKAIPTVTLQYKIENGGSIDIIKNFSNVGERTDCENPFEVNKYFDNLIRLGLLENPSTLFSLTNKGLYDPLKNHQYLLPYMDTAAVQKAGCSKAELKESYMQISDYGKAFCEICLGTVKISAITQNM